MEKTVAVLGDSWATLRMIGDLLLQNFKVIWLTSASPRLLQVMPVVEEGPWLGEFEEWIQKFEIHPGPLEQGSYLREFKNKSFHELFLEKPQVRFKDLDFYEIQQALREQFLKNKNLTRIEGSYLEDILTEVGGSSSLVLGSGEKVACDEIFISDAEWGRLSRVILKKGGVHLKKNQHPLGFIQLLFKHSKPIGEGMREAYFGALNKEAGEEESKEVFGYFFSQGTQSLWTLALSEKEIESNHEIGKKIKKMNQTINKMFDTFLSSIGEEQVRLVEPLFCYQEPFYQTQIKSLVLLGEPLVKKHKFLLLDFERGFVQPTAVCAPLS